jgi:hypothetical protein
LSFAPKLLKQQQMARIFMTNKDTWGREKSLPLLLKFYHLPVSLPMGRILRPAIQVEWIVAK